MPTAVAQPNDLKSTKGIILEIGIYADRDFGALVQPFSTNDAPTIINGCKDAVDTFIASNMPALLSCISSDASIAFVSAVGMVHGLFIPYRVDYAIGAQPGTRGAGLAQGQLSALCLMYCSNNAPAPHGRMQIGKAFIPALCDDDLDIDEVKPALVTNVEAFEAGCCNATTGPLFTWYRVGSARHTAGATLPQIVQVEASDIVATQRRRLRRLGA